MRILQNFRQIKQNFFLFQLQYFLFCFEKLTPPIHSAFSRDILKIFYTQFLFWFTTKKIVLLMFFLFCFLTFFVVFISKECFQILQTKSSKPIKKSLANFMTNKVMQIVKYHYSYCNKNSFILWRIILPKSQ